MEVEKQRALAMARARLRLKEPEKESPYSATNLLGAATEPLLTMTTGIPATILGGLTAAGSLLFTSSQEAEENMNKVIESLTYQPRTEGGQTALEAISYPFRKYAEATQEIGERVRETSERTKEHELFTLLSPEMKATITKTGLDIIPTLLGAKGISGKPALPKVDAAIKKPFKMAGEPISAVKQAISHRLPGGKERVLSEILSEVTGPKRAEVIKALEKAKPGETAGQASTRTGSYEFSALQKMLEKHDPSGYGDIYRAQQHGRLKELKKIGKTPEKLKAAEALMSKHAEQGYGAVRDTKTNVTLDSLPKSLSGRPSVARAIEQAKDAAMESKTYFPQSSSDPLTIGNLQRIKRALADEAKPVPGTPTPLGKTQLKEIGDTARDYTSWLRKKSPDFAKAEDLFGQEATYVARMKVGQAMSEKLKPKLGTKERATQFANAMEDTGRMIKKETGRYDTLDQILKPKQMSILHRIKGELDRDVRMTEQAVKGAKRMNELVGTMYNIPKVSILERSIVILNSLIKRLEGRNTAVTLDMLASKMKDPKEIARLMKKANKTEKDFLTKFKVPIIAGMIETLEEESGEKR